MCSLKAQFAVIKQLMWGKAKCWSVGCCETAQAGDCLPAQRGAFEAREAGVQSSGRGHFCLPSSVLHCSMLTAGEMKEYSLKETLTQHAEAGILRSFMYQTASGLVLDEQMLLGLWVWSRHVSSPCSRTQRGWNAPVFLLSAGETCQTCRKTSKAEQITHGLRQSVWANSTQTVHVAKLQAPKGFQNISEKCFCELSVQ